MMHPPIEPATLDDLAAVTALLAAAALPAVGLTDQFPAAYVVAREGGRVAGCAGLEQYGHTGLLRSVAVVPSLRGSGLARAMVERLLDTGRAASLEAIYLLTTTAAAYFPRLGFTPAARAAVPLELAASPEMAGACPASAICMVRRR
jgi:amino-acid N-acetyltransferase